MAAVAALSSCSSDEEGGPAADIPVGFSDVEIRLSGGGAGTRASIESDDNGLFEAEGLGIFALARGVMDVNAGAQPISWAGDAPGTKTYAVLLDNAEADATKDGVAQVTNIEFAGGPKFYPMGNWYRYGFYGYYPRTETIEMADSSCTAVLTITGKEDVIYGKAVNDDEDYAYSALYFRQTDNTDKVPAMQFGHKLMRITFSAVPGPDTEGGSTYTNATNMKVKSIRVLGVPTEGRLVLADLKTPQNEGTLTFDWEDTGAMENLELTEADDQPLTPDNYYMEAPEGEPREKIIGQGILLPVPEAGSGYKYKVEVTLEDKSGNVYECSYPQELTLGEDKQFEAGKSYNVKMTINGPKEITLQAKLTKWETVDGALGDLTF